MSTTDLRQVLGRQGEQWAREHLERRGYHLVARNHRTRFGEIDLIVANARTLVFCEVKTRRAGGRPFDGMTVAKRRQVRRMAAAWLAADEERPRAADLRFDAIGITVDASGRLVALEHVEAAF